jgi:hypothetical protein
MPTRKVIFCDRDNVLEVHVHNPDQVVNLDYVQNKLEVLMDISLLDILFREEYLAPYEYIDESYRSFSNFSKVIPETLLAKLLLKFPDIESKRLI